MNPLQRIRLSWDDLAGRERGLIVLGLAVLLPIGFYLYLWQPAQDERERLAVRVQQLRGDLAELRANADEVRRLQAQAPANPELGLEALARQSASRIGLPDAAGTVSAQGNELLRVDLASVEFAVWVRWLGELGSHGVSLSSAEVVALPTPGLVRVKATLRRTAG